MAKRASFLVISLIIEDKNISEAFLKEVPIEGVLSMSASFSYRRSSIWPPRFISYTAFRFLAFSLSFFHLSNNDISSLRIMA